MDLVQHPVASFAQFVADLFLKLNVHPLTND